MKQDSINKLKSWKRISEREAKPGEVPSKAKCFSNRRHFESSAISMTRLTPYMKDPRTKSS